LIIYDEVLNLNFSILFDLSLYHVALYL